MNLLLYYIPLFATLAVFSVYLRRALEKMTLLESKQIRLSEDEISGIPNTFSLIGILGTFIGIAFALFFFDVDDIDSSISTLLAGMNTAFWTSILGIGASLYSSRRINKYKSSLISSNESAIMIDPMIGILNQLTEIRNLLYKGGEESISLNLSRLRHESSDQLKELRQAIVGDGDSSLATQFLKLRDENKDSSKQVVSALSEVVTHVSATKEIIVANHQDVTSKFDQFSEQLEKSNTEALVQVIEKVIGGFNERLNELIERLVKENFEELNQSVKNLNDWQIENKKQVEALIEQYRNTVTQIGDTAKVIDQIAKTNERLVSQEGVLAKSLAEIDKLFVEENKLAKSVERLDTTTIVFQKTGEALAQWQKKQDKVNGNIEELIESISDLSTLYDETEGFFDTVKRQMQDAAGILDNGNKSISDQLNNMQRTFTDSMNKSFQTLDSILQDMVIEYAKRMQKR
jgi:hypothetical protein